MGNVLVIDHNADTAQAICRLLQQRGHQASILSESPQVLHWLDFHRPTPDVVVLDWMMPDMDGGEVLRLIKNHPAYHAMRIVIFSGAFEQKWATQAHQLGVADYFVKGTVSWDAVLQKVETLIDQQRTA
jgi:two-component system phosphate regulon response regulator PhoB